MIFWLTFDTTRGLEVFIVRAGHLTSARMKAGLAGQNGTFQKGHELDTKTAKKIPAKMIGKTLPRKEAEQLLERL